MEEKKAHCAGIVSELGTGKLGMCLNVRTTAKLLLYYYYLPFLYSAILRSGTDILVFAFVVLFVFVFVLFKKRVYNEW